MTEIMTKSLQTLHNKIYNISNALNQRIITWYIKSGLRNDLNEFRPGFVSDDDYLKFILCFEILRQNIKYDNEDELLYNFIIYYYILVVFETYVLDQSYHFDFIQNYEVQKWMYEFSLNNTEWASNIRRILLNFNLNKKFETFYIRKFNPYENLKKK